MHDTDLEPLPDDFIPTPRDKGEPEPPPMPDPFGHRGVTGSQETNFDSW